MSDETDKASEREELERECGIRAATQAARGLFLPAVGACYYCGEETPPGARFCDSDCRDSWQHEQAARKRAGRW